MFIDIYFHLKPPQSLSFGIMIVFYRKGNYYFQTLWNTTWKSSYVSKIHLKPLGLATIWKSRRVNVFEANSHGNGTKEVQFYVLNWNKSWMRWSEESQESSHAM